VAVFYLLALLVILTAAYAGLRAAPWVPIMKPGLDALMESADIREGEIAYDLGCGDGRVLIRMADTGANATGYEVSLLPYLFARLRLRGKKNARAVYGDFWSKDLSHADLVFFFLTPRIAGKMAEKLKRELRPGARAIAYVWPLPGWEPRKVVRREGVPPLYCYVR
jgi:SAM-dependent methyltransferase